MVGDYLSTCRLDAPPAPPQFMDRSCASAGRLADLSVSTLEELAEAMSDKKQGF
jgi:hypothetical protein